MIDNTNKCNTDIEYKYNNVFFKVFAGIFTALLVWLSLNKYNKDISVLLTLAVSAMAVIAALTFLQPIVDFLKKIQSLSTLDSEYVSVIFKVVGIGIITEISSLICKDAGNESLGKILQFVSSVTALWMSIPIFEKLLELFDTILGAV